MQTGDASIVAVGHTANATTAKPTVVGVNSSVGEVLGKAKPNQQRASEQNKTNISSKPQNRPENVVRYSTVPNSQVKPAEASQSTDVQVNVDIQGTVAFAGSAVPGRKLANPTSNVGESTTVGKPAKIFQDQNAPSQDNHVQASKRAQTPAPSQQSQGTITGNLGPRRTTSQSLSHVRIPDGNAADVNQPGETVQSPVAVAQNDQVEPLKTTQSTATNHQTPDTAAGDKIPRRKPSQLGTSASHVEISGGSMTVEQPVKGTQSPKPTMPHNQVQSDETWRRSKCHCKCHD